MNQKCPLPSVEQFVRMFCPLFVPFSEQVLTFALFRCHDVGGRDPDVQFSDSETCRQEEIPLRRPQQRPPGDPSKGSHAAESKEEMMARAVRMKRKTKSCDA